MLAARRTVSKVLGILAAALAVPALPGPFSGFANAQDFTRFTFNSEGPSPAISSGFNAMSHDLGYQRGTDTGAVQSILVSPTSPSTLFIGTVNGGVWSSTNGGGTWAPLTDNQSSLSIGAMAFKADDSRTIYAGIGLTSNGSYVISSGVEGRGGLRTGILVSSDGGGTWRTMDNAAQLQGKSVVGVAGSGNVVLAATAEYNDMELTSGYGLYRSIGGGQFSPVPGLPTGPATSLAGSGTTSNPYVVAIANAGVFRSVDNGASWQPVGGPTLLAGQAAKVAVGPTGAIAVAIYNTAGQGQLVGLWLAPNGTDWRSLQAPPGGQANTDLALAIDPSNPSIVYVGVNTAVDSNKLGAYRITAEANGGSTLASITNDRIAFGTTHADARGFAFDAAGHLLVASDGGVYVRSNPQSETGLWRGLNTSTLTVRESYAVAYDSLSKRLLVAAQDAGTVLQDLPRQTSFSAVLGGDGLNAAVNDRTNNGRSILYTTGQHLGFVTRLEVDAAGQATPQVLYYGYPTPTTAVWNFERDDFSDPGEKLPFFSRFVLNKVNPRQIAIGTNYVYVTTDEKITDVNNSRPLTNVSPVDADGNPIRAGNISALAFGTKAGAGAFALAAGTYDAYNKKMPLLFSRDVRSDKLAALEGYSGTPSSIVFDTKTFPRFYVANGENVQEVNPTTTTRATYFSVVPNLSDIGISQPTALEVIDFNGVYALLVGGIRKAATERSPIAVTVANSNRFSENAMPFGSGLPNTMVNLLTYNSQADVLAVGLWGRGIWTLYDVTSYFPTAEKLLYGLANNDSTPDAYYLSNGTWGSRPLEKYGSGTLTINGRASYGGTTTVYGGTLAVNGSIASSSGLTVGPGGTLTGGGLLPVTTIAGTIAPGFLANAPTTARVQGNYTQQAGSAYNMVINGTASDSIAVAGAATLQGGTVGAQVLSAFSAPRQTYTIVNAAGGLAGSFAGASLAYPFLQPSLSYDANNAYLTLTIGGFAAVAQNPVQSAVGSALDASVWQSSGDYATVLGSLALLNSSQVQPLLTALSGMNYSGLANSIVQGAQLFMSNFQAQAGNGNGQRTRIAVAEACDVACETTEPGLWGAWGGALGGFGTVGASQPLGGVTYNLGGFAGGLDRRFGTDFLAGVALGYTAGTQWVSGFTGQSFTNTVQMGLYGSYTPGPYYIDGLVGYAFTGSQTTRSIAIPTLPTRTAVGQAGVNQLFGQVEGGWRFDIASPSGTYVTPFVRLQAYGGKQGTFTENGAQSLDLTVAAQTTTSLRSVLGAQLGGAFDLGWRDRLAAQLRLGWSHEYADTSRPVSATLAGAPQTPFVTYGVSPNRDGVLLGLSASTAVADATSAYLRYEGLLSGQDSSHAITAGLRLSW